MAALIDPKILKGFRDFLPAAEIVRRELIQKIENSFRLYGFVPIDTPALEYSEILLGKGGGETEKQIYRFTDNGQRDVALRFDLTVPFARFTAQHQDELYFPFKRYHIAKVWRGENTQKGRYREFMQCDFDTIGSDNPAADFEILLLIRSALRSLGLDVSIRLNHRGLFNAFLSGIGVSGKSVEILRTVDKIAKAGTEEIQKSLVEIAGEENTKKILDYINAGDFGKSEAGETTNAGLTRYNKTLERLTELSGGPTEMSERVFLIGQYIRDSGAADSFTLDPSITRGLDYYTGIVFETFLTECAEIGSICSGGRYDNLCGLYTKKPISGVGASIGLDRMIAAMESLGKLPSVSGSASLAIACVNQEQSGMYQAMAEKFRGQNIFCEVFSTDNGSTLVKQFISAEKRGIRWLIIPDQNPSTDESSDSWTVRNIAERKNHEGLSLKALIELIHSPDRSIKD